MAARKVAQRTKAKRKTATKPQKLAPKFDPFASCANKPTTERYADLSNKSQLQLASCCLYVKDVLNNGYTGADVTTRTVLKRFMKLLAAEKGLLDYCFIQFDVKSDKIDDLRTKVATLLKE